MKQNAFKLLFGSKEFDIPAKFGRLSDLSTDIYDTLIFSPDHQYTVKSKVSEEVFQSFIKSWLSGDTPDIHIDNYFEYSQLSNEFNLFTDLLEQKKEEFGSGLHFFTNFHDANPANILQYERNTSENLDSYLNQYGAEMMKLPIKTLYSIFSHPNRKLKNHDSAYKLILKEYETTNNESIFILIQTLDGSKLSQENLKDSIFNQDEHCGFLPKINDLEYLNVFNSEEKIEQNVEMLHKIVENRKEIIDQLSSEIDKINERKTQKINEFKKTIKTNTNQIQRLKKKQNEDISMIEKTQKNEIINISDSFEKQKQDLKKIKKKHSEDIKKLNEQVDDQINQAKSISEDSQTIEPFVKKDHPKKNKGKSIDIVFDSSENGRFNGIIHYLTEECDGNVHKKGAVEVTSSSVFPKKRLLPPLPGLPDLPVLPGLPPLPGLPLIRDIPDEEINPINTVDLDNESSSFISGNHPDSWICYDFVDAKVKPNAYSIRSYVNGKSHLMNWQVEGSNDQIKWNILDKRTNEHSLDECGISNTFFIEEEKVQNFYRYIRLKQIGKNTKDNDSLCISAFEIFGSFIE